jgi:hypothetical protein
MLSADLLAWGAGVRSGSGPQYFHQLLIQKQFTLVSMALAFDFGRGSRANMIGDPNAP